MLNTRGAVRQPGPSTEDKGTHALGSLPFSRSPGSPFPVAGLASWCDTHPTWQPQCLAAGGRARAPCSPEPPAQHTNPTVRCPGVSRAGTHSNLSSSLFIQDPILPAPNHSAFSSLILQLGLSLWTSGNGGCFWTFAWS